MANSTTSCVAPLGFLCFVICLHSAWCSSCGIVHDYGNQIIPLPNNGSTLFFEGCRWNNASVQWFADGPFALTFRNVVVHGGILTVTVKSSGGKENRSNIIVDNCTLIDCFDCLHVASSSSMNGIVIAVRNSMVQAVRSAVSLSAPDTVSTSSITIHNSQITACRIASIHAPYATDIFVVAISSYLTATGIQGEASSTMALIPSPSSVTNTDYSSMTARNVSLYAMGCSITTSGAISVSSLGFALYATKSSYVSATNVTVYAARCNVTTTGDDAVAALGFAVFAPASTFTATKVTLYAIACSITTSGVDCVAALGFAAYHNTQSASASFIAASLVVYAARCNVNTSGRGPDSRGITSVGFAALIGSRDVSSVEVSNAFVGATECNITSQGKYPVSSVGFATFSVSTASATNSVVATNVTLYALECSIIATGEFSVCTLGMASYGLYSSHMRATNVTLFAADCNISARGSQFVSSLGLTSQCNPSSMFSSVASSRMVVASCESYVTAQGNSNVASVAAVDALQIDEEESQWLLVRSDISSSGSCVTLSPSADSARMSVAFGVASNCTSVGWKKSVPYCGNISGPAPYPTLSPSGVCPLTSVSCQDLLPLALPAPPSLSVFFDVPSDRDQTLTAAVLSPSRYSVSASTKANFSATFLHRSTHPQQSSTRTPFSPSLFSFSPSLLPLPSPVVNPISRLLSSSEAAQAIVASGATTAALAGLVTATSMGHATRMASLMRSVECSFASSQLDPPSLVDLPLQWNIDSPNDSLGVHAGSALFTSAMLVVLPLFACAVVHTILSSCSLAERPALRSLQRAIVSRYCLLSFSFFVPNVTMSTVVVVGHGASSGAVAAAALAVVVPLLFGCVAGQRALMLDVDVTPLPSGKFELRNRQSSRAYAETYGGLVDGCRDAMQCTVRVCFVEDVIVSLLLSLLSGVSTCTASCEWVALAMLVVSALHLLYVACVRPLRSRVESSMNFSLCAVQVVMAALCLAIASGSDNSAGVLMKTLGVVALIQNASFFVQATVLAACACVSVNKKKHVAITTAAAGSTSVWMEHPLLATPSLTI